MDLIIVYSDRSAKAEYIVPPNRDRRVASFSTRVTPFSLRSWKSLSKPTGYGTQGLALDRSYSTIRKEFVTGKTLVRNMCWF